MQQCCDCRNVYKAVLPALNQYACAVCFTPEEITFGSFGFWIDEPQLILKEWR